MANMKKISDLILRMQPYAEEIKKQCRLNADFANAFKTLRSAKFISLGVIITSRAYAATSAEGSEPDEIIGLLVYDIEKKTFKQDFIVNVEKKYREFRIYTRFRGSPKSRIIRDITHFYQEYPMYSKNSHHPSFEELPDVIKPRALEAVQLANKLIAMGGPRAEITDDEYNKFDAELRKLGL